MFKPTLLALSLACLAAASPAVASSGVQDVQYHVTVMNRSAVVFEGEGRVTADRALELRQFVLARDNAGQGKSFVDSGVKVVVQQTRHDDLSASSQLTLDIAGLTKEASAAVDLKLGEESTAEMGGYTVKVYATAVQPKESPAMPEDFAYLAPSFSMGSLALPNVWFDRSSYQLANAVLARPAGGQFAAVLVAPTNVAHALDAEPLLYAARR